LIASNFLSRALCKTTLHLSNQKQVKPKVAMYNISISRNLGIR
jgi:hypothetical protein